MTPDTMIASAALAVSIVSLLVSLYFFRRSFRPIVTATVKNSGTIPAKNIRIRTDAKSLEAAFGADATTVNKRGWLAAFDRTILILHNGDHVKCSFGTTSANNSGFWKYEAIIPVVVTYQGWFGSWYIQIVDSTSFTQFTWD